MPHLAAVPVLLVMLLFGLVSMPITEHACVSQSCARMGQSAGHKQRQGLRERRGQCAITHIDRAHFCCRLIQG